MRAEAVLIIGNSGYLDSYNNFYSSGICLSYFMMLSSYKSLNRGGMHSAENVRGFVGSVSLLQSGFGHE